MPRDRFQWAPTLGGECYSTKRGEIEGDAVFQWAPTLGGECYEQRAQFHSWAFRQLQVSMGTHPWG